MRRFLLSLLAVLAYGGLFTLMLISSVLMIAFFAVGSKGAGTAYLFVTFLLFCGLVYLDTPENK